MRKVVFALLLFCFVIGLSSCTNDEGDPEFDTLQPQDSTNASVDYRSLD